MEGWEPEQVGKKLLNLFDVANASGLFVAAGNDKSYVLGQLSDLHAVGFTNEHVKSLTDKVSKHEVKGMPSLVGFTSDEKNVYVCVDNVLSLFAVNEPDVPFKTIDLGEEIVQVLPNPRVGSDAAVVTAKGSLLFVDLAKGSFDRIEVPEPVTRACWSPKGKQIVAGTSGKCSIYQLRPDGSTAAVLEAPEDDEIITDGAEVAELVWLETHLFYVSYTSSVEDVSGSAQYIITRSKDAPNTYKKAEEDISAPSGYELFRGRSWYTSILRSYAGVGYLLATNYADSNEITMFTKDEILRATDDTMTAITPFRENDDHFAIGLGLDVTSTEDVDNPIPGSASSGPLPLMWLLDDEGYLSGWYISCLDGIKQGTADIKPLLEASKEAVKEATDAESLFGGEKAAPAATTAPATTASPFTAGASPFTAGTSSPFGAGASSPFTAGASSSPFAAGATANPFSAGASKLSFSNFTNPTVPDDKPKSENAPAFGSNKFGEMKSFGGDSPFGKSSFGSGTKSSGGAFGAKVTFGGDSKESTPAPESPAVTPAPTIRKMNDDDSEDEGHSFKFDEGMADDLEPTTEGDQTDAMFAAFAKKDDAPKAKTDDDSALLKPFTAPKKSGLTSRHAKAEETTKEEPKEEPKEAPKPTSSFFGTKPDGEKKPSGFGSQAADAEKKPFGFGSQATEGKPFAFGQNASSESAFLSAAAPNPFAGKGFFGSDKKDEKPDTAEKNEPKITELSSEEEGKGKKPELAIEDKPKELLIKDGQSMERVPSRDKTPIKELIKKFDSSSSQDLNKDDLQKLKASSGQTKSTPEVAVEDEDDEEEDEAIAKLDEASFTKHTKRKEEPKYDDDAEEESAIEKLDEASFAKESSTSKNDGESSFAQFGEDGDDEGDFESDFGDYSEEELEEEEDIDDDGLDGEDGYVYVDDDEHDGREQTESINDTYDLEDEEQEDEHDDEFDKSIVDPALTPAALPAASDVHSGFEPASSLPAAPPRAPMVSSETQTDLEPEPEPEPEPVPFEMPLPVPSMEVFEDPSTETPKTLDAAMEQIYLEVESEFQTLTENCDLLTEYLEDQIDFQDPEYANSITEVERWRLGGAYLLRDEIFEELEKVTPYAAKYQAAEEDITKCNKAQGVLEYKIARYQSLRPQEQKEEVLRQRALSAREQKLKHSLREQTETMRSRIVDLQGTVTQMKAQTIFLNNGTYSTSTARIQAAIARYTESFRERLATLDAIEATQTLDNLSLASGGNVKAIGAGEGYVAPDESTSFIVPSDTPFANSFRQLMGGRKVM